MNVKIVSNIEAVLKRAREASVLNLGLFGGLVRKFAIQSIKIDPKPSAPGSPPHSRKGLLKKAIVYAVDREQQNVVIGPTVNVIGDAGSPHEFGGEFRGKPYPARPFMGPAKARAIPALDNMWKNSVK